MKTKLFSVYVPLPQKGKRCGERISMWRDDVVAAVCTTKEAAAAAKRLLGDATETWEHPAVREERRDHDCCCDD